MKDIDFDELDRAVSSVLGQSAKSSDEKPTNDSKKEAIVSDETSVKSTDETSAITPDIDKPEQNTSEPFKPATTPLAIKRRGKFMDVMHPSADMNPSGNGPVKAALPRPVITPLLTEEVESSVEHTAEPTAVVDEAQSLIGAEPATVSVDPSVSDDTQLESSPEEQLDSPVHNEDEAKIESLPMAATSGDETGDLPSDTPESLSSYTEPQITPSTTVPAETADESPSGQTTPFLSDTQVEKRPLGAFGETETDSVSSDGNADSPLTTADTQSTPVISLPRELQPDVVGVESVQENEAIETSSGSSSPFAAKVGVAPEANDGRVEGHPLFDTSTYHEPIAAVHHGVFPGWAKWLIGLLVCLAIGAGVGYFLFTTGL